MATYISADDFRVKGEKTALYLGFGILAAILLFMTAGTVGLVSHLQNPPKDNPSAP